MVVLLRAFTHLDAYEDSLERAGLRPYVVGGRGYWSQQQVADVCALLATIANPLDDQALFGALASPACGRRPGHPLAAARRRRARAATSGRRSSGAGRRRARSSWIDPERLGADPARRSAPCSSGFAATLAGCAPAPPRAAARRADRRRGRPRPATTWRC